MMIFYSISRFFFFLRKTKNGTGSFSSTMENLLRHSSLKNVKWMREIQQSKYVRDFFFGVLYTMFLGLGDWKLENEEEWLIQVRCCLHCCLLPSGSWWKGLKFFFFFDTSENHLHVKKETFFISYCPQILCFGACYSLQFNFLVTAAWPIFCLII